MIGRVTRPGIPATSRAWCCCNGPDRQMIGRITEQAKRRGPLRDVAAMEPADDRPDDGVDEADHVAESADGRRVSSVRGVRVIPTKRAAMEPARRSYDLRHCLIASIEPPSLQWGRPMNGSLACAIYFSRIVADDLR